MAPTKFEENMRESLEKRTIQPSTASWDKLSEKLDNDHLKNNGNRFWWLGIAAALIVMVSAGYMFFQDNDSNIDAPQMVEVEKTKVPEDDNADSSKLNEIQEDLVTAQESTEVANVNSPIVEKLKERATKVQTKAKGYIAEEESENPNTATLLADQQPKAELSSELSAEALKINEVVAEIKKLQQDNISVTEREIDSLLKSAQKELINKRIYNANTRIVDADALLQDVEADLQDSFREKVFDALKNSYETVKTAVVQRNN
ncbi:hypothetical protein SAMN03097699_2114 [Flavobacteriaceae bacterium MAR_2010_188]|nr:hypothetical protein SAMN03097699_2114 [Flavobacteriaceae bacterium MAR_2010_188]